MALAPADFFLTPCGTVRGADLEAAFSSEDGFIAVSERLAGGEVGVRCFESERGVEVFSCAAPGGSPRPFWGAGRLLWVPLHRRGEGCLRLHGFLMPSGGQAAEVVLDVAAARHAVEGVHRDGTHCQIVSYGKGPALFSVVGLARPGPLWRLPWPEIVGARWGKGGVRFGPFSPDDGTTLLYARGAGRVAHLRLDGTMLREVDRRDRNRTLAVAWAERDVVALVSQQPSTPHESWVHLLDLRAGQTVHTEPLHRREDGWAVHGVDARLSPDGARWLLLWSGARRGEVVFDLRSRTLQRLPEDIGSFRWMGSAELFTGRSPWGKGRYEIVRRDLEGRPRARGHYRAEGLGPGFHSGWWAASPRGGFFSIAERWPHDPTMATLAWFATSSLQPGDVGHPKLRP